MIKLSKCISKTYTGFARYFVAYDYAAGLDNRYTVMILTAGDPVIIGRELDLKTSRSVINSSEELFKNIFYTGDRRMALKVKSLLRKK